MNTTASNEDYVVERLYAIEVEVPGDVHPRVEIVRAHSVDAAVLEVDAVVVRVNVAIETGPGEYRIGQEVPHALAA